MFQLEGLPAVRADFDDEVHAVYAVDGKFCIVGELSVFVYDTKRAAIVDRFQAEDVLGASWWTGGEHNNTRQLCSTG